jgi:WD40 repeat protein
VNDLKFAIVDNNKMQLASAGADQTIKLIDVKAILQKNYNEDVITLKGHDTWIYALYYTPDGLWLFSAGEDNKVIAWKPTMNNLYQTLYNSK